MSHISLIPVSNEDRPLQQFGHQVSTAILTANNTHTGTTATPCEGPCACSIVLLADPSFFTGPDGRSNVDYAISVMVNRMNIVNDIYANTEFSGVTGYRFLIKGATVFQTAGSAGNPVAAATYTDASKYLEAFSKGGSWKSSCLAHMFTYREFDGGILGLAWVGNPASTGGICDPSNYNTVSS